MSEPITSANTDPNDSLDMPRTRRVAIFERGSDFTVATISNSLNRARARRSAVVQRFRVVSDDVGGVEMRVFQQRLPWLPPRSRRQLAIPTGFMQIWDDREVLRGLRNGLVTAATTPPPQTIDDFVANLSLGVVASPSRAVATNALIGLATRHPNRGVGIYTTTEDERGRLTDAFMRAGLAPRFDRPQEELRPGDIAITTLLGDADRACRRDLHVFWTESAVRQVNFALPYRTGNASKFLFRRTQQPLAPYDEQLVRAAFGFHELRLTPSGGPERRIELIAIRITLRSKRSDANSRSALLWRSQLRNRLICNAVRAVHDPIRRIDSLQWLKRLPSAIDPRAVAVVVGSTEQREIIARKLGQPWASLRLLSPELADDQSLEGIGVVVRADGNSDVPDCIVKAKLAQGTGPLVVVDFRDRGRRELQRWAQRRFASYATHGIGPIGAPAHVLAQKDFLTRYLGI